MERLLGFASDLNGRLGMYQSVGESVDEEESAMVMNPIKRLPLSFMGQKRPTKMIG
jgi:hypothetical protein